MNKSIIFYIITIIVRNESYFHVLLTTPKIEKWKLDKICRCSILIKFVG